MKTLDDAVQEELKDIPKEKIKIMDAGAGTGLVGVELHKFGFTTIDALDISPGMLNEAKKKNVYTKFICAVLGDQRIPEVETGEYDVLICIGVFAIAHVPPVALVEMMRMVRPGEGYHKDSFSPFPSGKIGVMSFKGRGCAALDVRLRCQTSWVKSRQLRRLVVRRVSYITSRKTRKKK